MLIEEKIDCSICKSKDLMNVIDLGVSPVANKFYSTGNVEVQAFPLILDFCSECFNLQLRHRIDESYLYDESYSYTTPVASSLDSHYSNTLDKLTKLSAISNTTSVVEIGSNNGNFLLALQKTAGKVLGIDPAVNVTAIANSRGIPTITGFFNEDTANSISTNFGKADLIVARHMFAHNSAPSEMIKGVRNLLAAGGTFLVENAYAVETLLHGEFDQIYHEHMFYYSASSMSQLMKNHGFELYDIYFSNVHGGSASFFICNAGERTISSKVTACLNKERKLFTTKDTFLEFQSGVSRLKAKVNDFVEKCQKNDESISIYSVPNKLFTFLSYVDFPLEKIKFMVDTSPGKIGKYYPNSNIEVISESELMNRESDVFLVGAWNYKQEILERSSELFKPGTKLVFALPFFDVVVV